MTIFRWRDRYDVIARLIDEHDITGFLKRDVVLNPGETAIVIANGKIMDVATQVELKGIGGGFKNWLKRKTDKESSIQLLFMVTTPIQCEIPIKFSTKDHISLNGTAVIRFQVDTTDAPKIINLIKTQTVLTVSELEERISSELFSMVFTTVLSKHDAAEFHGNIDIQKELEGTAIVELRKTLSLWGLNLVKMFTIWQDTVHDQLMKYKAELALYDKEEDAYHRSLLNNIRREHNYDMKIQEYQWDLRLGELEADEREKTQRFLADLERRKADFNEDIRQEREQLEARKDALRLKLATNRELLAQELEQNRNELDMAMDAFDRVQAAKRERMAVKSKQDDSDDLICPHCKSQINSDWKICPKCEKKL